MAVQVPLAGSYSSVLAEASKLLSNPPATRTIPSGSKVAVWSQRAVLRLPVAVQVPLAGSYSSALASVPTKLAPPATSTIPSDSKVAVWLVRAVLRLPVAVQVPLAGSYSSVLAKMPALPCPPQQAPSRRAAKSPCGRNVQC